MDRCKEASGKVLLQDVLRSEVKRLKVNLEGQVDLSRLWDSSGYYMADRGDE